MTYCSKCGTQMNDEMNFCPACGTQKNSTEQTTNETIQPQTALQQPEVQETAPQQPEIQESAPQQTYCTNPAHFNDKGGFLWGLLGFFFPQIGLTLYLVWKDIKPKTGKAAGIGALVSAILIVLLYILIIVIYVALFATILETNYHW